MFKYIDQLREKPVAVRKRYALGISLACVTLIAGVWVVSITSKARNAQAVESGSKGPSPLSALVQNFSAGYSDIKKNISESNPFNDSATMVENEEPAQATSTASTTEETVPFGQVIISDPGQ
jgi:hypothetical protein